MIDGKRFFCVRGYMKSGTNWVCNLLNLHPDIRCIGEFHWHRLLEPLCRNFETLGQFKANTNLQHFFLERLDKNIKETMVAAARSDATWIGDRNPSPIDVNIFIDSPVFHIYRDGRDVLVSRAFHLFNRPEISRHFDLDESLKKMLSRFKENPGYFHDNPNDLLFHEKIVRESARGWAEVVSTNLRITTERPDLNIMPIRYEQLHSETEKVRREMYKFLNLKPRLAAPLNDSTRAGFESERPNQFYRKGAVGDWQKYMTDDAKKWFNEEAGDLLVELGYAENLNY